MYVCICIYVYIHIINNHSKDVGLPELPEVVPVVEHPPVDADAVPQKCTSKGI